MPFWPLRPVRAQNQLRFGLNPQQLPTVMRRQAFGFGPARSFCVSCFENSLCNSVSTMGCSPHSMRWSISSPGCSAVVAQGWLQRHPKSRGTGIKRTDGKFLEKMDAARLIAFFSTLAGQRNGRQGKEREVIKWPIPLWILAKVGICLSSLAEVETGQNRPNSNLKFEIGQ